jgi:hypothetical protein
MVANLAQNNFNTPFVTSNGTKMNIFRVPIKGSVVHVLNWINLIFAFCCILIFALEHLVPWFVYTFKTIICWYRYFALHVYSCAVFYEYIGVKHPARYLEAMFYTILTTNGGLMKVLKFMFLGQEWETFSLSGDIELGGYYKFDV